MLTDLSFLRKYPEWSLILPEAVPFPHEPFRKSLDEHRRLLEEHRGRIREELRKADYSAHAIGNAAIIVDARKRPPEILMMEREDAVYATGDLRGAMHTLLFEPPSYQLYVAVCTADVLSLHLARLEEDALVYKAHDIVVEPFAQMHRSTGYDDFSVTRWMHPDGEVRYAWVPVPPIPETEDEAIDRIVVKFDWRIRREIKRYLDEGGTHPFVAAVTCSISEGDAVGVYAGASVRRDVLYPSLREELTARARDGIVPVVVMRDHAVGVRWLAMAGYDGELPPATFFPVYSHRSGGGDTPKTKPRLPPERPKRPTKPMGKAGVFRYVMDWMGKEDAVDVHLTRMPGPEIDAAIERAGYDPHFEHATSWLRASIVEAIAKHRDTRRTTGRKVKRSPRKK
jgi:hypothetical protein